MNLIDHYVRAKAYLNEKAFSIDKKNLAISNSFHFHSLCKYTSPPFGLQIAAQY